VVHGLDRASRAYRAALASVQDFFTMILPRVTDSTHIEADRCDDFNSSSRFKRWQGSSGRRTAP